MHTSCEYIFYVASRNIRIKNVLEYELEYESKYICIHLLKIKKYSY